MKVCVVTGTRAEYGLMYWLLKGLQETSSIKLQLIATGMHLEPDFGLTYQAIEKDGFKIDEKIKIELTDDSPSGIARSMGLATIGFGEAFKRLKPEMLVLTGDRFEILAAAQAALVARIPIAHLAGGDTTEGAFDEAMRHSITKMSHLHFVTNEVAAKRVRQLGENPEHIFNVGSPGIDNIKRLKLLSRSELEKVLEFKLKKQNLLLTFHPVTLDATPSRQQFEELLSALKDLGSEVGLIFTLPNADTDGRTIAEEIKSFVEKNSNACVFASLGQMAYLSAMAQVDAVVGNSSSGLYEAPSLKKATVNIGDRQKGRLMASSVVNCAPQAKDIAQAIRKALDLDCTKAVNPYGDGSSSEKILEVLKKQRDPSTLVKKHFFDQKGLG